MPPGICFTLFCGSVSSTTMHLRLFSTYALFYGVAECSGGTGGLCSCAFDGGCKMVGSPLHPAADTSEEQNDTFWTPRGCQSLPSTCIHPQNVMYTQEEMISAWEIVNFLCLFVWISGNDTIVSSKYTCYVVRLSPHRSSCRPNEMFEMIMWLWFHLRFIASMLSTAVTIDALPFWRRLMCCWCEEYWSSEPWHKPSFMLFRCQIWQLKSASSSVFKTSLRLCVQYYSRPI